MHHCLSTAALIGLNCADSLLAARQARVVKHTLPQPCCNCAASDMPTHSKDWMLRHSQNRKRMKAL